MKLNSLRTRLQAGHALVGTMIQEVTSPFIVHVVANAGFDFVYVDMEHGRFELDAATGLIQTMRLSSVVPLARVPDNQYHLIARVMDAGAQGVMIPRVENRQHAEAAAQCMRFPPLGRRGLAVARGHNDYKRQDSLQFTEEANRENLLIAQIESVRAVENIEEIITTPGVDVALIGPGDLSLSLGIPLKMDDSRMMEAIMYVVNACRRHQIIVGLHVGDVKALRYWGQNGIQLLSGSSDLDILLDGSLQLCQSYRQAIAE